MKQIIANTATTLISALLVLYMAVVVIPECRQVASENKVTLEALAKEREAVAKRERDMALLRQSALVQMVEIHSKLKGVKAIADSLDKKER